MANDITAVMYEILARSLTILRETAWGPQIVSKDYQAETNQKGDTIVATTYPDSTPYEIEPSHMPLAPKDTKPGKISLVLDQWYGDNFHMTDKEMREIADKADFMPKVIATKVRGLGNAVNRSVLNQYVHFPTLIGTPDTTPFSHPVDRTAAMDGSRVSARLTENLAPRDNRFGLLNEEAVAQALVLPQFSHAEKRGNNNAVEDATVGTQYGVRWLHENGILRHEQGYKSTTSLNTVGEDGANKGDTVVPITSNSGVGTYTKGDVITFAGSSRQYTVVVGGTSSSSPGQSLNITVSPALSEEIPSYAAVAGVDSHNVNLCIHRDSIILATRLLDRDTGNPTAVVNDPVTGITMRLEKVRQRKQVMWELDTLWGVKTIRPEWGLRLVGTTA